MRSTTYVAVLILLLVLLAGTGSAEELTPEQRFDAASDLLGEGKLEQAADALVALADAAPDSPLAPDALFAAAGLFEDKLAKPVRAAATYRRLVDKYPDSRTALAASRRLADLDAGLGPDQAGARALAIWSDVLARFPERAREESVRIVEVLIKDHPTWNGRPRALVWLATLHHRHGEWHRALVRYRESAATAKDAELRFEALLGAGTVLTRLERFGEARAILDQLPVEGSPGRLRARDDAHKRLTRAQWRARLYTASFAIVLLVVIGLVMSLRSACDSWRSAARAVRRPPLEVVYMAPVALVFVVVSFTAHYAIAPAVIIVCVGGCVVTWLSGAALRASGATTRWRPLAHVASTFLGIIALSYIAMHRTRLIDMLIETVRFGPDV